MDEFEKTVTKFLDTEDQKIFASILKDPVTYNAIKKIFEKPSKIEKYLFLIKNNLSALYIIAKLSERISVLLEGEDEESSLEILFLSIKMLLEKDKKSFQQAFDILKNAIERRIEVGKYETAAKLVSKFYSLGLKNYVRLLVFHALELADAGDHRRAASILELLPKTEEVLKARAQTLFEWGKEMAASDPETGLKMLEESLKIESNPKTMIAIAEVYENAGNYEKAYKIYKTLIDYPGVQRKLVRLLMDWGEEERRIEKLEEAYSLASDAALAEEILRKISNLKSQRLSGS